MKNNVIGDSRVLKAEEGMLLTNGDTDGTTVVLPLDADYTVWHEVTEAELPKEEM